VFLALSGGVDSSVVAALLIKAIGKQLTCVHVNHGLIRKGESEQVIKRAGCKHVRFHDLRHTFATMALENGMDVKTLSAMIGHVSAATTLDIYSNMADTMQMKAAVNIDRKIGKTDAPMPEVKKTPEETAKPPVNAPCAPTEPHPEPVPRKIRKSGTDACIR